ncbi:hypothetical protein LBMAG27_03790 [Bacteroidota bacterium]|nr:hypothetical protein LBMAG27_03790 [Bacteroidota bacterium]
MLVPILNSNLNLGNIVGDTIIQTNSDNSLQLVYESNLYSLKPGDGAFQIPDTIVKGTYNLTNLALANQAIVYNLSLGQAAQQMGPQGQFIISSNGTMASIPAINNQSSGDNDVNATQFFQTAILQHGFLDITIFNGFPIDISNIQFQIKNKVSGTIVADTFFTNINSGSTSTKRVDLSGKTVEGTLVFKIIDLDSPGSATAVLIDTTDALIMTMQVTEMVVTSATAIFPSQDIINQDQETIYNLSGGAKLKFINVHSGKLQMTVHSAIKQLVHFNYGFPGATDQFGGSINLTSDLPPAPVGGLSSLTKEYDLAGYRLDLTGLNHTSFNSFVNHIAASIDSTGQVQTLSFADSIYIDYGLVDIIPEYIEGFLGQQILTLGPEEVNFDLFKNIQSGSISLEDVNVGIDIENGVGVNARLNLYELTAVNSKKNQSVSLTNSLINSPQNLAGATDPPLTPSLLSFLLNTSNSNIKNLVEVLPDKMKYKIDLFINPNGNTSNYNDFAYYNSPLNVNLNINMPLSLQADGLVFQDTVAFDLSNASAKGLDAIKDGVFSVFADNGFPLQASLQLYLYDEWGGFLDSLIVAPHTILAAPLNSNCKVSEIMRSTLQVLADANKMNKIRNAKKAVVRAVFDTKSTTPCGIYTKIYSTYNLSVKLTGRFTYLIGQ